MMLSKLISTITFIGISLSPLVSAAAIAEREVPKIVKSPLTGFTVAESFFEGNLLGKHFKLNGSATEVLYQLKDVISAEKLATGSKVSQDDAPNAVQKRSKVFPPKCIPINNGQNWVIGDSYQMGVCANALRNMGNQNFVVPPHACGKICSNGGIEVWVCNNRGNTIYPNCLYLGSMVNDIRSICKLELGIKVTLAGGQLYETEGYSVVARRA